MLASAIQMLFVIIALIDHFNSQLSNLQPSSIHTLSLTSTMIHHFLRLIFVLILGLRTLMLGMQTLVLLIILLLALTRFLMLVHTRAYTVRVGNGKHLSIQNVGSSSLFTYTVPSRLRSVLQVP